MLISMPNGQVKTGSAQYIADDLARMAETPGAGKIGYVDSRFVNPDGSPRVAPNAFTESQARRLREAGVELRGIRDLDKRAGQLLKNIGRHRKDGLDPAAYQMVAKQRENSVKGAGPDGVGPDYEGWLTMNDIAEHGKKAVQDFLKIIDKLPQARETNLPKRYEMKKEDGMKREFNQIISKINRDLEEKFDYIKSNRVRIHQVTHSGNNPARFGLAFDPHQIEIITD